MIPEKKHIAHFLKIAGLSLGGILILIVLLLAGATWWLTPERLTRIVNREASEYLEADVKAENIRFTLWSSWPHLRVEYDSLTVRSRVFDSIPDNLRQQLPDNADFLASTGKFQGGINLLSLIKGEISLRDVDLGHLKLNLVALNDSTANYNIITSDSTSSKIPYFTANKIRLLNPGIIRYRSIPDSADAAVAINSLSLERLDKKRIENKQDKELKGKYSDSYLLKILGNVDARVGDLNVLQGFPFGLAGNVAMGFDPFRFATSGYNVNLGTLHGNVDMKMQMGEETSLDDFRWHLDNFDLLRLLSDIPGIQLPTGGALDMPLTVNVTARLTSPWRFSSTTLPSAEVDFNILDNDISYSLSDGKSVALRHEGAGARLIFDGINPEASSFVIPPFRITGDGVDLTLSANATDLLGSPHVEAQAEGNAGLLRLSSAFPIFNGMSLKGDIVSAANISCDLVPLSQIASAAEPVKEIAFAGKVDLHDFSAYIANTRMKASGKNLEMLFSTDIPRLDSLSPRNNKPDGLPFLIKGENINVSSPQNDMNLQIADLAINGQLPKAVTQGGGIAGNTFAAQLKSNAMRLTKGKEKVDLKNIDMELSATREKTPIKTTDYKMPAEWLADSEEMKGIDHTDPFLRVNLPADAKRIMSLWRPELRLKIGSGVISTPSFPAANTLRNLDVVASFDSVVVRNLYMRSRSSAMSMRGKVRNLRQFLNSSTPAPLYVGMDVAIDTIQVNQLAGTYMHGAGAAHKDEIPDSTDNTKSLLLPRNIVADIRASAKESRYLNLHLYDLNAGVGLRNGNLNVDNLHISADFGHAFMNFGFKTEDIQNISMSADASLMDVNLVRFFDNFHTLLLMMPQMKNLQGEVSAEANLNLLAFPNMCINIPSVEADIRMQGDGLTVHQSPFIRRITRMLLIREEGDLKIADMNVHASIHDNLLELYPFNFIVDKYRLRMGGLNNFDGDLYYHIGVEKSPIPFPFGINVVGNFSKPKIRFGGAHWKLKKGEEITASVMEQHRVNIVAEGKKFIKEFLRKAAEADKE